MRVAKPITLTAEQRATLTKWSRGRSTPVRLVQRAKILLAAVDGHENKQIAADWDALAALQYDPAAQCLR